MKNYKHVGMLAFFVLMVANANAQIHQALASGGGNASGTGGSVSYTIGQVAYTTSSGASGMSAAGIQTIVNLNNPLPIELLRFEGVCMNGQARLNWQTGVEINNDFFAVEKSIDAKTWTSIATIKGGKESKDYSFTDLQPLSPVSYYRLKQVDMDGQSSYSPVIHLVGCTAKTKAVVLYPNPTATGIYLAMENPEGTEYELYNINGVLVCKDKVQNNTTYIDMSPWTSGTYFLKLKQNNTLTNSFSIIKN